MSKEELSKEVYPLSPGPPQWPRLLQGFLWVFLPSPCPVEQGTFKSYVLSGQMKADESGDGLPVDTCLFITEGDTSVGKCRLGHLLHRDFRSSLENGETPAVEWLNVHR